MALILDHETGLFKLVEEEILEPVVLLVSLETCLRSSDPLLRSIAELFRVSLEVEREQITIENGE